MKVPWLNQNDPRWAGIHIGSSNFTVGQKGCLLVAIINGLNALGLNPKGLMPGDFARNVALFTDKFYSGGAGLCLIEKILVFAGGKARFLKREDIEHDEAIVAALRDPDEFVILQVNQGAHFSLALRQSGSDFIILDSWDGKQKGAKAAYHSISGARYFQKVV